MTSPDFMRALLATALAGGMAMAVVLMLRGVVRRWLGASAAYLLWLAVPAALLGVLLPAPRMAVLPMMAIDAAMPVAASTAGAGLPALPWPLLLVAAWLAGALAMAARLRYQQRHFVRGLGPLRRREDGVWQARGSELSDVLRVLLLAAEVARRKHGFTPYFQGHAEGRALRAAYDTALEEVDVLAMPTVAGPAGRLPDPEASLQARFDAAVETTGNTAPFNLTGHPAITVPCGLAEGLPVGLMFVARHGDEAALFRAAAAVEAVTKMPAPPGWG